MIHQAVSLLGLVDHHRLINLGDSWIVVFVPYLLFKVIYVAVIVPVFYILPYVNEDSLQEVFVFLKIIVILIYDVQFFLFFFVLNFDFLFELLNGKIQIFDSIFDTILFNGNLQNTLHLLLLEESHGRLQGINQTGLIESELIYGVKSLLYSFNLFLKLVNFLQISKFFSIF